MRSWTWGVVGAVLVVGAGVAFLGGCGTYALAQKAEAKPPADLARIPAKGVFLVSVRPADLWEGELAKGVRAKLGKTEEELAKEVEREMGLPPAALERLTFVLAQPRANDPVLFARANRALDRRAFLKKLIPGGKDEQHDGHDYFAGERRAAVMLGEREYVFGIKGDIQSLLKTEAGKATAGLAPALALAAKKHSLVVGVNPQALAGLDANLPEEAAPFKPLLKALWGTVTLDVGAKTAGKLHLVFDTPGDATDGQKAIDTARTMGVTLLGQGIDALDQDKAEGMKAIVALLSDVRESLKVSKVERDGKVVKAGVEVKVDTAKIGPLAATMAIKLRDARGRAQSSNNLKQIGLAMHNYLDQNGAFPAHAIYDKDGKPGLSWRVQLLPYLDQKELYDQFKLNEPWDSAHNKKLIEKMPAVFRAPNNLAKKPGGTFIQGFFGKGAFFEGKTGVRIADITDGTSNTIMVVEGGKEVPWTKPEDINFDADKKLPKLGGVFPEGFNAGFADGSVRFMSKSIKEETLKMYITRNGGEVIPADQ
jgi:hypothetical protein